MIYYDLSFEAYANLPGASPSSVKPAGTSLRAWKHFRDEGREPTDAMQFGTAVHMAILEPQKFATSYDVWRGGIRRGKEWEVFCKLSEDAGRSVITGDEQAEALLLQSVVHSHPVAKKYIKQIEHVEVAVTWEENGLPRKCRTDAIGGAWFADLKTIRQLTKRSIISAMTDHDYSMQMYANWFGWRENNQPRDGKLIFVETNPPYDVAVVPVSEEMLMVGKTMWQTRLERIEKAKAADAYPGIAWDDELNIDLPEWYVEKHLELIGADNVG